MPLQSSSLVRHGSEEIEAAAGGRYEGIWTLFSERSIQRLEVVLTKRQSKVVYVLELRLGRSRWSASIGRGGPRLL